MRKSNIPMLQYRGKDEKLPSNCSIDNAYAKEVQMYTGDKMIGIGQLHKSNAVPVFSQEEAIDLANMRR